MQVAFNDVIVCFELIRLVKLFSVQLWLEGGGSKGNNAQRENLSRDYHHW